MNGAGLPLNATHSAPEAAPVDLNEQTVQDTQAKLAMMLMSACWTPAAALRVVVELNIPQIMATQAPAPKHMLTCEEIVKHVPNASKPNPKILERTMRLMACKSVFTEEVEYSACPGRLADDGQALRIDAAVARLGPSHPTGTVANFVKFATVGPVYGKALDHLRCDTRQSNPPSIT